MMMAIRDGQPTLKGHAMPALEPGDHLLKAMPFLCINGYRMRISVAVGKSHLPKGPKTTTECMYLHS